MKFVLLFLAVLCNVVAYILFKTISGKQYDILWISLFSAGLLLGAVNTFLFTKSLKELSLGIAYPLFSVGSIIIIMLVSAAIFGEKIKAVNAAGAAVAIIGIVLLTR